MWKYADGEVTVYAIGACYENFSGSASAASFQPIPLHQQLFEQAQATLHRPEPPRHLDYVCTLLVGCFYLLATSQTDAQVLPTHARTSK